jgi:hypothetical protein
VAYFHVAAAAGDIAAMAILARRYVAGDGVHLDIETAAYYYVQSAKEASRVYHTLGQQPL